ncbi:MULTISPECIES: response regulator transcription factor [Sphingobacterium]|jgi:DNA-binding response OmpR family regulator|uniref:response regulator transcription factor n=1 Tax=Sphingobacterium TaxID=28453 RepID=UPI0004E5F12E|nr:MULTISPECIES: response regulator transcription factor [Sphingobacterium]CDT05365.1 Two component response regulator [Sphingobacterium sp. PM2-P1-29]SJN48698.1 two-component system response regulator [Sphingobacterium faecium PCAi_F2.5]UPZ36585.1 response regulator transcription factor [Sphingobacterium sp. PCS056]UXD68102.1 response regulator transcription factor [Sphingobacterium faecium]WGQ15813.1 response regulator transcription factor [Sphingobacterium faecium]
MSVEQQKIILVEDEQGVADLIVQGLEEDGYRVIHLNNSEGLEVLLSTHDISLVLLDILLPGTNGLEICRQIRFWGYTDLPVMMLTALGTPENVVLGLDNGADDYLSKPFKLIELKARIRSLIRRKHSIIQATQKDQDHSQEYKYGFLKVDDYKKVAYCDDQELNLTSTEYRLLLLFIQSPKKVFERSLLLDKVWGINFDIGSNVVDVYVNYLRKKIEKVTSKKAIHTVIGMGYVLKIED